MDFFNPNAGSSNLFEMGGPGHLALLVLLFGLLALLTLSRSRLRPLRDSRVFMVGTAAFILAMEGSSYALKFIYPFAPAYERLPLHLCASLKIAVAVLCLLERYDLAKYISLWAVGAGFISFANLNLEGASFGNFGFWTYLIGHLYLFLIPVFLFLTGDFRYDLRSHLRSMAGLFVWSLLIFLVNWIFDTNYMYSGPHNHTVVPFIPDAMMVWPFNYVSYAVTGLVLLNVTYALLMFAQRRMGESSAAAPAALSGCPDAT
jgi:hypothetical integral membrane protein (TIGR02206 family)